MRRISAGPILSPARGARGSPDRRTKNLPNTMIRFSQASGLTPNQCLAIEYHFPSPETVSVVVTEDVAFAVNLLTSVCFAIDAEGAVVAYGPLRCQEISFLEEIYCLLAKLDSYGDSPSDKSAREIEKTLAHYVNAALLSLPIQCEG